MKEPTEMPFRQGCRSGITGRTRVCAVIGNPIAHSLSPAIHNAAFKSLGMDLVYVAFSVRAKELPAAIRGMKALGVLGINVTMPHKSNILPLLDRLEEHAKDIVAVNTVVTKDEEYWGHNTDGVAATAALEQIGTIEGRKALVLGAGGAASSIVYQLSREVASITILNRTTSRASRLTAKARKWGSIPVESHALNKVNCRREIKRADLLVNTLPVDVFPAFGDLLTQERLIRPDMLIMDANYRPKTGFIANANLAGARAIDGLEMLVRQAALSFRLWTGTEPPIDVMRDAAIEAKAKQ